MAPIFQCLMILWIFYSHVCSVDCSDPIEFPDFHKRIFEFDFVIEHHLTMSTYHEFGYGSLVDFDPNSANYSVRNMDPALGCRLGVTVSNTSQLLRDFIPFDGTHRRIITINHRSPGETITVPFMSEVVVRVHNHMHGHGVSLHYHGLNQMNRWYMDGVVSVQQCPIASLSTFTYRFLADFPGTMWYHGHFGMDRGEGLYGAMIVYTDKKDVFRMPALQYSVVLFDVHTMTQTDVQFNSQYKFAKFNYGYENRNECWRQSKTYDSTNMGGSSPMQSILINGIGWHNQKDILTRPWSTPMDIFKVSVSEPVLYRVVHAGNAYPVMLSIDDHRLTIIAADGADTVPFETDFLVVYPGERYDILITAKQQPSGNRRPVYYLLAETLERYNLLIENRRPTYAVAKIVYRELQKNEETNELPDFDHRRRCTKMQPCTIVNCPFTIFEDQFHYQCKYAEDLRNAEAVADKEVMSKEFAPGRFQEFFINMHFDSHLNGWKFQHPKAPPYFHDDSNDESFNQMTTKCDPDKCPLQADRDEPKCRCFNFLKIKKGVVVQMTLTSIGSGLRLNDSDHHPFHLHGQHFYVMKVGRAIYDSKTALIKGTNKDIYCRRFNSTKPKCVTPTFADSSWNNGNVSFRGMNTVDPPYRDTINIPAEGYLVIRFRASNPGWFYAHCHLLVHHMNGMAMALKIGDTKEIPAPPTGFPKDCGVFEPPPIY